MLIFILITVLLGIVVGFCAGLLGIGGGLIVVPALVMLLPYFDIVPAEHAMVVAVATSLSAIIVTSSSSVYEHNRLKNVPWRLAITIMVGAAMGAWAVGFFAHRVNGEVLQLAFGICVLFLALRMLFSRATVGDKPLPSKGPMMVISTLLGGLASLLGIGGGALFVPVLNYFSVDMRRAIGCAAASGIAIAVFGTLGYVISGWGKYQISDGFLGYIYIPALLSVVVTSVFTAPIGARMTQRLPLMTIKKVFGVFLLLVSAKMIF